MNTTELIEQVSKEFEMTRAASKKIVNFITDTISKEVSCGREVKLMGFGVFYLLKKKPRRGHNPKTGKSVNIPERRVPRFRAGKVFREAAD